MNKLKQLRTEKGWQQKQLAAMLHVNANTISRYESEQLGLDAKTINQICDIFDCTADYLLCRSDSRTTAISNEDEALLRSFRAADEHTRSLVRLALEPFSASETGRQVS